MEWLFVRNGLIQGRKPVLIFHPGLATLARSGNGNVTEQMYTPTGCITLKRLLISLVVVSHAHGVSMETSVSIHLCLVYSFIA